MFKDHSWVVLCSGGDGLSSLFLALVRVRLGILAVLQNWLFVGTVALDLVDRHAAFQGVLKLTLHAPCTLTFLDLGLGRHSFEGEGEDEDEDEDEDYGSGWCWGSGRPARRMT
jgi:hypothetical protein